MDSLMKQENPELEKIEQIWEMLRDNSLMSKGQTKILSKETTQNMEAVLNAWLNKCKAKMLMPIMPENNTYEGD